MSFELRDHTADVGVAATGGTLEAVVAALADGLAAASCDEVPADVGERFSVSVAAESRDALVFDYLDELIYLRDVRAELPVDNEVRIDGPDAPERGGGGGSGPDAPERGGGEGSGPDDPERGNGEGPERPDSSDAGRGASGAAEWSLAGSARGVPLESVDAREIKAVTYSEMRLEEIDDGWEAYVVFDV